MSEPEPQTSISSVETYRAIRYARSQRFGAPQAVRFEEALIGSERGPVSPQLPSRLEPINGPQQALRQDEHCQVLSVSTTSREGSRPVLVWLHGGAYVSGGGELDWYDGDALVAEHDIVFVSVTYRLGALGYLRLPGSVGPSNGLADQIEALRWVRANIHRFGGDADAVTVAGQSAGAHSIRALIEWGHGGKLFHRAIAHSCPAVSMPTAEVGEAHYKAFVDALGSDPLTADPSNLLGAQARMMKQLGGALPFAPTAPATPVTGGRVDVLTTWTAQDAGVFVLNGRSPDWLATLPGRLVNGFATRAVFRKGSREMARLARASGGDAEMLRIDWSSDNGPWRACHCVELPLLMGSPNAWSSAPALASVTPDEFNRAGTALRKLWGVVVTRDRRGGWANEQMISQADLRPQ